MSPDSTVDVGSVEDFPEGTMRIVTARGREIGVSHWGGSFYALRNVCPHQSAPLCAGRLISAIESGGAVGAVETNDSPPVIACPWHGWEFHVDDGRSVWDDGYKVRAFAVAVRDGRVLVDLSARRREPS